MHAVIRSFSSLESESNQACLVTHEHLSKISDFLSFCLPRLVLGEVTHLDEDPVDVNGLDQHRVLDPETLQFFNLLRCSAGLIEVRGPR